MTNMNDVAREAGVSRGTVSNYLNGKNIKEESKNKIREAIKKLNYVKNNAAHDLRSKQSSLVVLIIPTVWTPFFSELTYWIQHYLYLKNYKLILCISEHDYSRETEYIKMANEQRVAGIITISYSNLTKKIAMGIPLVSIERELTGLFPLVSSDNYMGGQLAAQELIKKGAEKLICLSMPTKLSGSLKSRDSGFIDYCNERHLDFKFFYLPEIKNIVDFRKKLSEVLSEDICPNYEKKRLGIFTTTDDIAIEALPILKKIGWEAPEDVQIIGFDGGKREINAPVFVSSIRQPIEEIAEKSVSILDGQIKEKKDWERVPRVFLPVKFVEGPTTRN